MKFNYQYPLILIVLLAACSVPQGNDIYEIPKTHRQGHGADPPPCPTCNDKENQTPKEVASYSDYGFIEIRQSSKSLYYLYPLVEDNGLKAGDSVYFDLKEHFVVDIDTFGTVYNYINSGLKITLAKNLNGNAGTGSAAGKIANPKRIRGRANLERISGLQNAGYVEDDETGKIYLSQEYDYFGEPSTIKSIYLHMERLQLFIGDQQQSYEIPVALDLQLEHVNFHPFGSHRH